MSSYGIIHNLRQLKEIKNPLKITSLLVSTLQFILIDCCNCVLPNRLLLSNNNNNNSNNNNSSYNVGGSSGSSIINSNAYTITPTTMKFFSSYVIKSQRFHCICRYVDMIDLIDRYTVR